MAINFLFEKWGFSLILFSIAVTVILIIKVVVNFKVSINQKNIRNEKGFVVNQIGLFNIINIREFQKLKEKEERRVPKMTDNYNVTSNYQMGGITAGKVFVGNQPRKLDQNIMNQLQGFIKKEEKTRITSVLGDGEAFQFANEIKTFLQSAGYAVEGVDQAVYTSPVLGQLMNRKDGKIEIIIGTKQQ